MQSPTLYAPCKPIQQLIHTGYLRTFSPGHGALNTMSSSHSQSLRRNSKAHKSRYHTLNSPTARSSVPANQFSSSTKHAKPVCGNLSIPREALHLELLLLGMNTVHMLMQSYNITRFHVLDVILILAINLSLARHLMHRMFLERFINNGRKGIVKSITANPGVFFGLLAFGFLALFVFCKLFILYPKAFFLLLLAYIPPCICFRSFPSPPPLDQFLALWKGKKHVTRVCGCLWLLRALDSVYLATILPLLAIQRPYLYYSRYQCLLHIVLALVQTLGLLSAQYTMALRQHIFLDGLPQRCWKVSNETGTQASRWRSAESYNEGQLVQHKGIFYCALMESTNVEPSEPPGSRPDRILHFVFSYEDGEQEPSLVLLVLQISQVRTKDV